MFIPVVRGSLPGSSHSTARFTSASQSIGHSDLPGLIASAIGQVSGGSVSNPSRASGRSTSPRSSGHPTSPNSSPTTTTKIRTRTVVRYVTRYQTVVRQVLPDIPAGAMLPSQKVVAETRFAVGTHIVCYITTGGARCDIGRHPWLPDTPIPRSCHQNWGSALDVTGASPPRFLCTNSSLLSLKAPKVAPGYDVLEGDVRCEVRSFGVNCFVKGHHGFVLSESGYLRY